MPELPEVERLRRSLVPHLVGARVVAARVHRADVARCFGLVCEAGRGELVGVEATGGALLEGARVVGLHRLGKRMVVETDGPAMEVHLGMSGQVLVFGAGDGRGELSAEEARRTHAHVVWELERGGDRAGVRARMVFRDPRRFGGLSVYPSLSLLREHHWRGVGPDALGVVGKDLFEGTRGSSRAIKAALLDQGMLAGVGNIYADESLFASGIPPRMHAGRLGLGAYERLAGAIRETLSRAIEAGGSSLRDYVDADGVMGTSQATHRVYGRGGLACVVCGARLRCGVVAQRTTVWCGVCQTALGANADRGARWGVGASRDAGALPG